MNVYELIRAKRDGHELSAAELDFLVAGYVGGAIPDYQVAAFLMAVFLRGMSFGETVSLTRALMRSGRVFDLSDVEGPKVDKHSTGGVGDKVSLILAPLVAACGVKVPMVSGRGLGHTGGTLDKLESIPGFRTDLSYGEFRRNLHAVGCALMGQTDELAPADKRMYALRDVTATVDSIPLIAASIMSKKLAEGIDALVLDVKTGNGAFMVEPADARRLARTMLAVGSAMGKRVEALITSMDQPLGWAVGNALEVIESIECLKGRWPPDLKSVTCALSVRMLTLARPGLTAAEARARLKQAVADGSALRVLRQVIARQGGNAGVIDDYSLLPCAHHRAAVRAPVTGFVERIDTRRVGILAVELGAGRQRQDDAVHPGVGFRFRRKLSDHVQKGDVLVEVLADSAAAARRAACGLLECYRIGPHVTAPLRLILGRVMRGEDGRRRDSCSA